MTVSSDNELVYLTDTAFNMLCIEADTGDIRWFSDGDGDSGYRVEPKLTEIPGETPVVYTIESMTGKVRQHNALTGFINWESDCSDRTDQTGCQDGVEAEFRYVFAFFSFCWCSSWLLIQLFIVSLPLVTLYTSVISMGRLRPWKLDHFHYQL
jgi:hypothetical protein